MGARCFDVGAGDVLEVETQLFQLSAFDFAEITTPELLQDLVIVQDDLWNSLKEFGFL